MFVPLVRPDPDDRPVPGQLPDQPKVVSLNVLLEPDDEEDNAA
jgi:hypothetical protein